MNNNGCIIPEINEQNIGVQQENATFLVIGDKAYTSEIIEEYNRNAAAKTEEFNTNATNKTNDFNTNYENEVKAFNSNAVTKTEDFDSHVTAQTNSFNSNAENATTNFNKNVVQQTDEFNKNAAAYNEGIQDNKKQILSTRDELYRLKTDILETGEATDTFIHLEDSAMAEFQELSVDGVLSQETTNGYQLFDVSKVTNISNGTIENEIVTSDVLNAEKQGVTYKFPSISLVANTTYYIFADVRVKSGTGSVNGINNGIVGWEKVSLPSLSDTYNTFISKYTPTENEKIYAVYLGFNNINNLIVNVKNVMITTDGNATYEPYTGGQPSPNPDYPQEIKTITDSLKVTSCGKNLFDINKTTYPKTSNGLTITTENGYFIINGTCTSTYANISDAINFVISAGTYTISIDAPQNFKVILKRQFANGSLTDNEIAVGLTSKTFTTNITSNRYYFFIASLTSGMTIDNAKFKIQFERKDNATPIENYIETQIQANLPDEEFIGKINDTYKDTLRAEYNKDDGQYHLILNKMLKKITLTGATDEPWQQLSFKPEIFNLPKEDIVVLPNSSAASTVISNRFIAYTPNYVWMNNVSGISNLNDTHHIRIRIKDNPCSTIAELRTWLSTHNSEVYYALAEPYEIDLGVIDMPLSYNEITNIFSDSELMPNINAKYYRNFTKTVQNLQVNEKSLKQELVDINNRLTALETAQANVINDIPTEESEVSE